MLLIATIAHVDDQPFGFHAPLASESGESGGESSLGVQGVYRLFRVQADRDAETWATVSEACEGAQAREVRAVEQSSAIESLRLPRVGVHR